MTKNLIMILLFGLFMHGCSIKLNSFAKGLTEDEIPIHSLKFRAKQSMICEMYSRDSRVLTHPQDIIISLEFLENTTYGTVDVSHYIIGKGGNLPPEYARGLSVNFGSMKLFVDGIIWANGAIFLVNPDGNLIYKNISGALNVEIAGKILPVLLTEMKCRLGNVELSEPYFEVVQ